MIDEANAMAQLFGNDEKSMREYLHTARVWSVFEINKIIKMALVIHMRCELQVKYADNEMALDLIGFIDCSLNAK